MNVDGRPFPNPFPGTLLVDSGQTVHIPTLKGSNTGMVLRQKCSWRSPGIGHSVGCAGGWNCPSSEPRSQGGGLEPRRIDLQPQ